MSIKGKQLCATQLLVSIGIFCLLINQILALKRLTNKTGDLEDKEEDKEVEQFLNRLDDNEHTFGLFGKVN